MKTVQTPNSETSRKDSCSSPEARRSDYDVQDSPLPKKKLDFSGSGGNDYQVSLSFGFILATLILSCLAAYQAGIMVRTRVIAANNLEQKNENHTLPVPRWLLRTLFMEQESSSSTADPTSTETSGTINHEWTHCHETTNDRFCSISKSAEESSSSSSDSSDSDSSDDDDEEEQEGGKSSDPVARHLSLDLDTMQQSLEDKMIGLIRFASSKGWTLQSHQCSEMDCVLLFDDGNRITYHSKANVLDIFSTDNETPLEWLDELSTSYLEVSRHWSYNPRGTPWDVFDAGMNDMYSSLLGTFTYPYRSLAGRQKSIFQEISFYDTIMPWRQSWESYLKSLSTTENNYYTRNPQFFQPDRQMYLDGVVQSGLYGEAAYHEALVHPSMLMHPKPERVAIIGAGEGATLREVLKHSCLKEVVMIDIDKVVMDMSREYLPSWNDCSDMILPEGMTNPTGNCFDDPRATVLAEDAIRWFLDRYQHNDGTHELFDVIIMDALDPGDKVEFSDMLFDNTVLVETFYRALSPNGIFLSQTGEELFLDDPNPNWTRDKQAQQFQENLAKVGFAKVRGYEEISTRFSGIWSFLLACKSNDESRWFATEAQVNLELQQRAIPTISGQWPFLYFDGATMETYHRASRPVAEVACKTYPEKPACQRGPGLDGYKTNMDLDQVYAFDGDKVVAQRDVEPGMYVGLEQCVHETLHIPQATRDILASFANYSSWEMWKTLTSEFGMTAPLWGERALDVDLGGYVWMEQSPVKNSSLETLAKGEVNEMYTNFWRIHSCSARREIQEMIKAG